MLVVYNDVHHFSNNVRLLQNNERRFPLIFTITVVEYEIISPLQKLCRLYTTFNYQLL
jgi:hypothetical protein